MKSRIAALTDALAPAIAALTLALAPAIAALTLAPAPATAALTLAVAPAWSPALSAQTVGDARVVPIQVRGDPATRFSLVVLSDGYTAAELGTFREQLDKHLNILWSIEPFRSYRNYINVYAVEIVSGESGITCDPAHREQRTTPLGMRFGGGCENPNARGVSIDQDAARRYAAMATPDYDQILAIANTDTYGGIGGRVATTSGGNALGPYITVHELGHSLGRLQDEYTYRARGVMGGTYDGEEPSSIHHTLMTEEAMREGQAKWWRWLGEPSEAGGVIGRYEGGQSNVAGIWRPSKHSLMISLGYYFDQVSRERMAQRISGQVELIAASTPTDAPVRPDAVLWIETAHAVYHELDVTWQVDGEPVASATNRRHLDVRTLELAPGTRTVTVTVIDPTPFVRDPLVRDTSFTAVRTWTVDAAAAPTSAASATRVAGADTASTAAAATSTRASATAAGASATAAGARATSTRASATSAGASATSAPMTTSTPAARASFTAWTDTSRVVGGGDVVYVETTHSLDHVPEVRWSLDGRPVDAGANPHSLALSDHGLAPGPHRLTATLVDRGDGDAGALSAADPAAAEQTLEWRVDNTPPTVSYVLSEPIASAMRDDGSRHYLVRDSFTMKLDAADDQPGFVVAEFRVNGDGWHHYYGWPDAAPGTPFLFTPRGTAIKELIYGSLSAEGLSPQPWEERVPGWGTHGIEYRARDAAGNIGAAREFAVTIMPSAPCDRVVSGTHAGALEAAAGVTCLDGATVGGPVTVAAGASLIATNSAVRGGVAATGADALELVGTSIEGRVRIEATTGRLVLFGNTMRYDAELVDNRPAVPAAVAGNSVRP